MNIFHTLRSFFGMADSGPVEKEPQGGLDSRADSERLADDPTRFADWVFTHLICPIPGEERLPLPTEEQSQKLSITAEQRGPCIKEFAILRVLGACMFVFKNLPTDYFETFKARLCNLTAEKLHGSESCTGPSDIAMAVERYLECLSDDDDWIPFADTYVNRVYRDNPNFNRQSYRLGFMPDVRIALDIPLRHTTIVLEAVRGVFSALKFNVSFESLEIISKVDNEQAGKNERG